MMSRNRFSLCMCVWLLYDLRNNIPCWYPEIVPLAPMTKPFRLSARLSTGLLEAIFPDEKKLTRISTVWGHSKENQRWSTHEIKPRISLWEKLIPLLNRWWHCNNDIVSQTINKDIIQYPFQAPGLLRWHLMPKAVNTYLNVSSKFPSQVSHRKVLCASITAQYQKQEDLYVYILECLQYSTLYWEVEKLRVID